MIPKANDENSFSAQKFISCPIAPFAKAIAMTRTIQLDRQFSGRTVEIQHVAIDGMLAPKFIAREISISEMAPQNAFAICGVFTEVARTSHWGTFEYCHFLREDQSLAPHLNPLPASGER